MQTDSTDIVKTVGRFRILCVGRAGIGKSSLISRVFGIEQSHLSDWRVGGTNSDIEKEYTSSANQFLVLHDSKGFRPGDTKSFDNVCNFIEQRRDENLPLKDQLHAVWLCTETPRTGGHMFGPGDEKLLQLAHKTQTPLVVIFTKYDDLIRSCKAELQGGDLDAEDLDKRSKEMARKTLDSCVQSLERITRRMQTPMPPYVNVSVNRSYNATISSLVNVTRDLVHDKLKGDAWILWTIVQRGSLPAKIEAFVKRMGNIRRTLACDTPGVGHELLCNCLKQIHQDIIASGNVSDDEMIFSSAEFKQLMPYLVQDVHRSKNHNELYYAHDTPSPFIGKMSQFVNLIAASSGPIATPVAILGFMYVFMSWLLDAVSHEVPLIQRLLMGYATDLTTVLKLLFDFTRSSGRATSSSELKEAFENYERSNSRQQIHRYICTKFEQDQQVLDFDSFHYMLCELVKGGLRVRVERE